jgi:hypothetical protein
MTCTPAPLKPWQQPIFDQIQQFSKMLVFDFPSAEDLIDHQAAVAIDMNLACATVECKSKAKDEALIFSSVTCCSAKKSIGSGNGLVWLRALEWEHDSSASGRPWVAPRAAVKELQHIKGACQKVSLRLKWASVPDSL